MDEVQAGNAVDSWLTPTLALGVPEPELTV